MLRSGWKLGFRCISARSGSLINTLSLCHSQCCLTGEVSNPLGKKNAPHPQRSSSYISRLLTNSFRKPVDPLPICIGLIPDVGVGQVGRCVEPLLEEVALHCDHQVNLQQAHGHHRWSHGHLEQGAVTLRPGA